MKKYHKFPDEPAAKRAMIDALLERSPNRDSAQMALHLQNPSVYPPVCQTKYLGAYVTDAETGECEIEVDQEDVVHFKGINPNDFRNTRAINVAQGPQS